MTKDAQGLRRRSQRRQWFFIGYYLFLSAALAVLSTGCSSARKYSNGGPRGLFQSSSGRSSRGLASSGPFLRPLGTVEVPPGDSISKDGFSWPLARGEISSFFGPRRRDFHDGIDIKARPGTPVHAARDGVVIYSGSRVRGYGNLIIVKHGEDYATVYAHNRKNLVRMGERVRRGQILAMVGSTGRATGPHLHFEVRRRETPQDPLQLLPHYRQSSSMARQ